jgi:septal ring factor EnvC (AmiA/AmiB activator)
VDARAFLLWPITILSIICSVAALVGVFWRPGSESSSLRRRILSAETDIASLDAELSRLKTLLKSISSRTALADAREKHREEQRPPNKNDAHLTKEQLKAKYLRGTHIDIARRAMAGSEE